MEYKKNEIKELKKDLEYHIYQHRFYQKRCFELEKQIKKGK
jgi:hypothetical protein